MGGTLMTGSLYWMAPEVVTNAGQGYNSKIDLWSLGCVVLEMLSGARPWQGLEMMPIILKVCRVPILLAFSQPLMLRDRPLL